jgi:hypothetical protein
MSQYRRLRCEALEDRRLLTTGSSSGTVFEDLDADGVQDEGELGLAGWTVVLERTEPLITIPNPAPNAGDKFGFSVAVADSHLVIGAQLDDTDAEDAGAAYVFDSKSGDLKLTLTSPNPATLDRYTAAKSMNTP